MSIIVDLILVDLPGSYGEPAETSIIIKSGCYLEWLPISASVYFQLVKTYSFSYSVQSPQIYFIKIQADVRNLLCALSL